MTRETVLVSACLLSIPCQYDGQLAKKRLTEAEIEQLEYHLVPVCPEQLAGLSTPRTPAEIQNGDGFDVLDEKAQVVTQMGDNYTEQFVQGAECTLQIAKVTGAKMMITQSRSPSCSSNGVYDGCFQHNLQSGYGVCSALLSRHGLKMIDVDSLSDSSC